MPKTVLVTGGCGYKGSVLVPMLLERGHQVRVVDTLWFGRNLPEHSALRVYECDVRRVEEDQLRGVDAIIHLASIANDPCGDLNPTLTWEVGALATMQLADKAMRCGVAQFIYASSGGVYGVKSEADVVETLSLEPISDYNKTKMVAERVLLSYRDRMHVQILRPATVCGLSPRMRLDVSVNRLTMQALTNGRITVFGGEQVRPYIHIEDVCRLYVQMLEKPGQLTGVFNAGFENKSIREMAEWVAQRVGCEIVITPSQDPRSCRLNSNKLLSTGFQPQKCVSDAIDELIQAFSQGQLADVPQCHNVEWMKCQQLLQ